MSNLELAVFSFICGWGCSLILEEIGKQWKKYQEIMAKIEAIELEESKCPHGYIDWDDCPDCRH